MLWSLMETITATTTTSNNIIITLVLLSVITLWWYWYRSHRNDAITAVKFAQRGIKFVKQPNLFLIFLRKIRLELMHQQLIQREGKLFGMITLGQPTIMLAVPELIGTVLSKEFTSFTNRRKLSIINVDELFIKMLSAAQDEQWKRLRSIITPTFSTGKLRQMKPCMDDTVRQLMHDFDDQLVKYSGNSDGGGLTEVNIKPLCGAYTMNTIIQVAFGVKVNAMAAPDNPIIKHARQLFGKDMSWKDIATFTIAFMMPRVAKFFRLRFFTSNVTEFFTEFAQKIVTEKRTKFAKKEEKVKASNFIELLLEAEIDNDKDDCDDGDKEKHKQTIDDIEMSTIEQSSSTTNGSSIQTTTSSSKYITNQEIIAQCVLFFIAGYDTTATTITMATYLLALNPDKQEKLHQEIVHVIQQLRDEAKTDKSNNGDSIEDPVRLITIDTLTRFEYLNAVINETLRLFAPATATDRMAAKDIELQSADGQYRVTVKKGDIILIPIYTIHHDEENFPNPNRFEPERFISGTAGGNTHHKYAYLPFGGGPRNCVARSLALIEVKLAIIHMIRRYRFTTNSRTNIPVQLYNQGGLITPKDIILSMEKRQIVELQL